MKRQKNISRNRPQASDAPTEHREDPDVRSNENNTAEQTRKHKFMRKLRYSLYILLLLVPLLYLAIQLQSIYFRPYRTQTAVEVTLSDAVAVQGVVVRQETPVNTAGQGVVGYLMQDGIRVPAGTAVAALYADAQSARGSEQSKELAGRIEGLLSAQTSKSSSADLETLTKRQQTNLYTFLAALEEKNYIDLQATVWALTESVNQLQIATGKETDYEELLARLRQQKEQLDQTSQPVEICTAPQTGFFISETDGYETVLPPQEVLAWDAGQLENAVQGNIQPQLSPQTIGKMITDYKWYLICMMDEKDAKSFEAMAGTHDKVQLLFHSSAQFETPAYVQSIESIGDGKVKMVLRSETMNAQVAQLRFEQIEVSVRTVTGLRIDKEALHVENGEYGVYVKRGSVAQYRRVTPIFEDEQYILVPVTPNTEKTGVNEVEMFDEIIVEGKDLYDGKLL